MEAQEKDTSIIAVDASPSSIKFEIKPKRLLQSCGEDSSLVIGHSRSRVGHNSLPKHIRVSTRECLQSLGKSVRDSRHVAARAIGAGQRWWVDARPALHGQESTINS